MSTSESIRAVDREGQHAEDREADGRTAAVLAQVEALLTAAFARRIPPSDASQASHIHLFAGDDARVTVQSPESDSPREILAPQGPFTRATLALPPEAMATVYEAAALARRSLFDDLPIETEAVVAGFTTLLQQWAASDVQEIRARIDQVASQLQRLRETIREWDVIVPLRNLHLDDVDAFEWGKLSITGASHVRMESLDRLRVVLGQSKHTADEQQTIFSQLEGMLTYYDGIPSSVARINVHSAEGSVEALALAETDAALNLLRCYIPLVAEGKARPWFGAFGTVTRDQFLVLRFSPDDTAFGVKILTEGFLQEFHISREMISHLDEYFAFEDARQLAAITARDRTPLQTHLVTAAQFLGQAVVTPEDWLSVALCANAVEHLLQMRPGDPEHNRNRRDRFVRSVISDHGDQEMARQRLENLGELRNQIVHRGPTYVEKGNRYAAEELTAMLWVNLLRFHPDRQSLEQVLEPVMNLLYDLV